MDEVNIVTCRVHSQISPPAAYMAPSSTLKASWRRLPAQLQLDFSVAYDQGVWCLK